jgi:predicted secreted protein
MPAINAHGSTVTFDSTAVGGLTSIGLPDQSKEEVEITSHDSAGWREFLPGLRDGGTVTLAGRLIPGDAGQNALDTNYNSDNTVVEVVITTAADSASNVVTYTFDAYVSATGGELPYDDAAEVNWTLRIDGEVAKSSV